MEFGKNLVNLNSYRVEQQYQEFYITGNIKLANDFNLIHKNPKNLKKEYTKAWIKLLSNI